MRKGILILQSILLLIAVLASNGCSIGVKDEPMPMSQENIEKYASAIVDAAKKVDPSAGTIVDRIIKGFKEPMEKKLGYNFDKSLRVLLIEVDTGKNPLSPANILFTGMIQPIEQIYKNTDEALKKGLISQRTYEMMNMKKKLDLGVNDQLISWLELAVECQQSHNNACSFSQFIETLKAKNLIPADIPMVDIYLDEQAKFSSWGNDNLVLKPDGSKISTTELYSFPFIVNKEKLELAKKYNQIIKEELASMGKK